MDHRGTVEARVLFESPQCEIASLIRNRLEQCESASLVAGFVTVDGISAISDPLFVNPDRLELLLIGAGTHKAFEACDKLIDAGVERECLRVHLGFTRRSGSGFAKYHPMLHSKVYLMEMAGGRACAFIGSHNLTGFAMKGRNGEAGVMLEGPSSAKEFDAVRAHISEAARQAVEYDSSMKDAYNWWAVNFLGGLKSHVDDRPKYNRGSRTILVLAERPRSEIPGNGQIIYFEMPETIRAMGMEVHLFLFDQLPRTPARALEQRHVARRAFRGRVVGLEDGRGGLELRADWRVEMVQNTSKLSPTRDRRVRPTPRDGMQQVRAELDGTLDNKFVYVAVPPQSSWEPILGEAQSMVVTASVDAYSNADLPALALGTTNWQRVIGLQEKGEPEATAYRQALVEMSPESGSYILMLRRLKARD